MNAMNKLDADSINIMESDDDDWEDETVVPIDDGVAVLPSVSATSDSVATYHI